MRMQRTLAPTAAAVPPQALATAIGALFSHGARARERLARELKEAFHVEHVYLVTSGKAALTLILLALSRSSKRRKVIIPAYTCFSVPSAVVKAGLEIVLCDVLPKTLDFNPDRLAELVDDQTLCVVPTHFFGRPADIDLVVTLCRPRGVVVVEDAAQAMGGHSKGRPLGTIGDVGFFSLGRGKNLSCGGGGVVLTSSSQIGKAVQAEYQILPVESWGNSAKNLVELIATELLIRPSCYWLPAGLPFLGLGETRFYPTFPMERMGEARAATLVGWMQRLDALNAQRQLQGSRLEGDLKAQSAGVETIGSADGCCLRFPLLVRDRATKQALLQRGAAEGLGLSGSYPAIVQDIPELQGQLPSREFPGAAAVVERLVTLPTHQFVQPTDRRRVCQALIEMNAVTAVGTQGVIDPQPPGSQVRAAWRS